MTSPFDRIKAVRGSSLPPTDRLVLFVYASYASAGGRAWPSLARVADGTGLNERSVRRAIKRLVDSGVLVSSGRGPNGTKAYTVHLVDRESSGQSVQWTQSPVDTESGQGGLSVHSEWTLCPDGVDRESTKESKEESREESKEESKRAGASALLPPTATTTATARASAPRPTPDDEPERSPSLEPGQLALPPLAATAPEVAPEPMPEPAKAEVPTDPNDDAETAPWPCGQTI